MFQSHYLASAMAEGIVTSHPVKMEVNIKEEVDETANLPLPPRKPSLIENEALVRPCKEEISQDEIAAMRELAIAASEQMQMQIQMEMEKACYTPIHKFHPKTGRIRTPRENSDSGEFLLSD